MRHEKILLVVLAYIIGFTTAYIGFGLTDFSEHKEKSKHTHLEYARDYSKKHKQTPVDGQVKGTSARLDELGLFAMVNGSEVVISGKLYEGVDPGPGFHTSIPSYEVSPTGKYVYYCEQEMPDDSVCHNYVYSVDEHTIHPVRLDDTKLISELETFTTSDLAWQDTDIIAHNDFISRSAEKPWLLTKAE